MFAIVAFAAAEQRFLVDPAVEQRQQAGRIDRIAQALERSTLAEPGRGREGSTAIAVHRCEVIDHALGRADGSKRQHPPSPPLYPAPTLLPTGVPAFGEAVAAVSLPSLPVGASAVLETPG